MLEFLEDIGKVFETTVYFFKVLNIDKNVIKIVLRIFLINIQVLENVMLNNNRF